MPTDHPPIATSNVTPSRVAMFDPAECQDIRDRVLEHRDDWIPRASGTFFTLGRAAYLDAPKRLAEYKAEAGTSNPKLLTWFSGMYDRLCSVLAAKLDAPVELAPDCALPGFHIFLLSGADRSRDNPALRSHFDLQWKHVVPNAQNCDHLTFTMLVEQPSGGASMSVWGLRPGESYAPFATVSSYAQAHPPVVINYRLGELVLHDGMNLHAIGNAAVAAPKGIRITLQGHGFRSPRNVWTLYW